MFLVCLECFKVIKERRPFDDPGVVPMICNVCHEHDDQARKRLGIQSTRNHKSPKSQLEDYPKEKDTSTAE